MSVKQFFPAAALAAGILCVVVPGQGMSGDQQGDVLAPVIVESGDTRQQTISEGATGAYLLDSGQIEDFGGPTGSFTDALKILPNIRFGEDYHDPQRLHDLKPSSVSISGGRYYENNFLFDGLSISNRLDPLDDQEGDPTGPAEWPSHEQSLFLDSNLIENMTVYDSNVPAAFGLFTGGVVDVTGKRAGQDERQVNWNYSTTRDDWVEYRVFHYQDPEDSDPDPPPEPGEFERERMGVSLDQPLGEAGLYTSLNRSWSSTPEINLGRAVNETQENISWLSRFSRPLGETAYGNFSLLLAPFQSVHYKDDVKDGETVVNGGGMTLSSKIDWGGPQREQALNASLKTSISSREAEQHYLQWANTPSRRWGVENDLQWSSEGGFGDLERRQSGLDLSWRVNEYPASTSLFSGLDYGAELSFSHVFEERRETSYAYHAAVVNSEIDCRGITLDCIDDEQYFSERNVYLADRVSVGLLQGALYAEASVEKGRNRSTLGLRYDYDNFLRNHNIAPRFRGSYDVTEDADTRITYGLNRYYGASLLAYKLREAREPIQSEYRGASRNVVNDWQPDQGRGNYRYEFDDASTPYSDEATLGVKQNVAGTLLELKAIARESRDEFSRQSTGFRDDGYQYYLMRNDGESSYRSLSASWFGEFGPISMGVSTTWSETTTTHASYDDVARDPEEDTFVFYRGERIRKSELDKYRTNFGRPLVASFNLAWQLRPTTRVSLVSRYRGEHRYIASSGDTRDGETTTRPDGSEQAEQLEVYELRDRPASLVSDLKFSHRFGNRPSLSLDVHVNNLFNARTFTVDDGNPDTRDQGIEVGRSYWLGLSGTF